MTVQVSQTMGQTLEVIQAIYAAIGREMPDELRTMTMSVRMVVNADSNGLTVEVNEVLRPVRATEPGEVIDEP